MSTDEIRHPFKFETGDRVYFHKTEGQPHDGVDRKIIGRERIMLQRPLFTNVYQLTGITGAVVEDRISPTAPPLEEVTNEN